MTTPQKKNKTKKKERKTRTPTKQTMSSIGSDD